MTRQLLLSMASMILRTNPTWSFLCTYLSCSYGDGQIKIFSVSNGALLGDIGAHSRSINALHIAQATGMVGGIPVSGCCIFE